MAKTTVDGGTFFVIVFVLGLALAAAYSGWLYQTGQQWFENCWQAQHSPEGPKTPRQAVSWGTCEQTTKRALFNAGFVFAGNPQFAVTPELKALVQACPSNYSDVPIGGPHLIAVDLVVQRGGPDLLDRFMPAERLIVSAFASKWPRCAATRVASGVPKIIEQNGEFQFEGPCKPCDAERAAMKR